VSRNTCTFLRLGFLAGIRITKEAKGSEEQFVRRSGGSAFRRYRKSVPTTDTDTDTDLCLEDDQIRIHWHQFRELEAG
jgi:hypothetical protein